MKRRPRYSHLITEINITPFTDIILVLLIIFLLVAPLIIQSSMQISLPEAKAATAQTPKTLTIVISKIGDVMLEGESYNLQYDLDLLKFKLSKAIHGDKDTSVLINADERTKYGYVVKVLDITTQLNVKHIQLGVRTIK